MIIERIITIKEMSLLVGKNSKTIWKWWAKDKSFPVPVKLNGRAIGWKTSDYQDWLTKQSTH